MSYNHIEPQSLNNYNHNPHMKKYIKTNNLKENISYEKKKRLTLEGRLLGIVQV